MENIRKYGDLLIDRAYPVIEMRDSLIEALENNQLCNDEVLARSKQADNVVLQMNVHDWIAECNTIERVIIKLMKAKFTTDVGITYRSIITLKDERRLVSVEFLVLVMQKFGKFLVDDKKMLYYFEGATKLIYSLQQEDFVWRFVPTCLTDYMPHIKVRVGKQAIRYGKPVRLYQFSHYDSLNNILYMFDGSNKIYKIVANQPIQIINNGDECVYFQSNERNFPLKLLKRTDIKKVDTVIGQLFKLPMSDKECKQYIQNEVVNNLIPLKKSDIAHIVNAPKDRLWQKYFTRRVNFRASNITIHMKNILFDCYLMMLPFREKYPNRILVALLGEKGSGKSSILKRYLQFFVSPNAGLIKLPDKVDDFNVITTNLELSYFDNVDINTKWLPDALATAVSNTTNKRRQLYSDNQLVSYNAKSWIGITTRTAKGLRRDDIADRLLIFYVNRMKTFITESELDSFVFDETLSNQIFSSYIYTMQDIVNIFAKKKAVNMLGDFRMADCGVDIFRIATEVFGYDPQYIGDMFTRLNTETSFFTIENSAFSYLVPLFLSKMKRGGPNYKRFWKSSEIYEILLSHNLDDSTKDRVNIPFNNVIHFSKALDKIATEMKNVFGVNRKKTSRGWLYDVSKSPYILQHEVEARLMLGVKQ